MNERAYIAQRARQMGLDPAAVLSIASVEGGFNGAVGDNGTSFGPFQLHVGGALPSGKGARWANSAAGINYALDHIAQVAKGLKGKQAISAISSRFERPADVAAEVAKASGRYGQFAGGAGLGGPASALASSMMTGAIGPMTDGSNSVSSLLQFIMQQTQAQAQQPQSRFVPF